MGLGFALKRRLVGFVLGFSLALCSTAHVAAKPQIGPDIDGAKADAEFRCIAQSTELVFHELKVGADKTNIEQMAGRLQPFISEVQNAMLDRYHVGDKELTEIYSVHAKPFGELYQQDAKAAGELVRATCEPLLLAREAVRTPHTPQRCVALLELAFSDPILSPGPVPGSLRLNVMSGVLGVLQKVQWHRWAKAELIAIGKAEKEADKILASEDKIASTERKKASKEGRAVVFDEANCNARFQSWSAQNKRSPA